MTQSPHSAGERALVSIIIPAYNAEATLEETVKSALSSTYDPIEVIVVDDGSTDQTPGIAEAFVSVDRRVRLVRRSNGGPYAAFRSGLAVARGEWIARLDADDLWHPTKLARQLEIAQAQPEAAFIYTFYRYLDAQGRVFFDGPPQRFPSRALCRSAYETIIGCGSSALIKRAAAEQVVDCGSELRNCEDLFLQVSIAARHGIAFVPAYLTGYRLRSASLSQDLRAIAAGSARLRDYLRRSFPQIPAQVCDWGHAKQCMSLAEGFVRRRQVGQASRMFVRALRCDPQWTSLHLMRCLWRFVLGPLRPRRPSVPGLPFLDHDPNEAPNSETGIYGTQGKFLQRLHKRRVALLQSLDKSGAEQI